MAKLAIYTEPGEIPAQVLDDISQLGGALDLICAEHPDKHVLVRLVNELNDELMVGLGPTAGSVTITLAFGEAVYTALGEAGFANSLPKISFEWAGQRFKMAPENLLPVEVVRKIVDRWMQERTRDEALKWEVCN